MVTGTKNEMQSLVDAVPYWFHSFDFGQGVVATGHKTPEILEAESQALQIPDLRGKTVLDIGAWDGYYSFLAERLGARHVVALDHYIWAIDRIKAREVSRKHREQGLPSPYGPGFEEAWRPDTLPGKIGFDTAHRLLNSKVEAQAVDFLAVPPDEIGSFDVVFFLGVLYHMQHPLEVLQRVAAMTQEVAIIETVAMTVRGLEDRALCEFYPGQELNDDPTNWWATSERAFIGLCHTAGFRKVDILTPQPQFSPLPLPKLWRLRPLDMVRPHGTSELRQYRLTAHAWK